MSSNGTRVIATFNARPGREEELLEVLTALVEPTRKEDGCRRYELWRSRHDRTEFTFVEDWSSDESLAAHAKSEHLARARELYPELIAEPVDLCLYDPMA